MTTLSLACSCEVLALYIVAQSLCDDPEGATRVGNDGCEGSRPGDSSAPDRILRQSGTLLLLHNIGV